MTVVTHDMAEASAPSSTLSGVGIALLSAVAFGTAGTLARPLLDAGWSPGTVTLIRIGLGAAIVAPFGLVALQGRWQLLRRASGSIALYGVLAVAGAQFCYFSAVQYLQVGPALLIEYTGPAAVVCWMWLRHGQRPGRMTLVGAVVAAVGLLLVLDLFSGADFHVVGTAWGLGAMVGLAAYFVISADEENGLPPLTLAAGGLVVGTVLLALLGVVGALPMRASTAEVAFSGHAVPWWLPLVLLGLVAAAIAYVTGIAASRRLGSRLASFVGLSEVVAAVLIAWLFLGELPTAVQLAGGVLILLGVIAVKAGERQVTTAGVTAGPAA